MSEELFHSLSNSDQLRVQLSSIASDSDQLREVAQKSYQHPNGFHKIVLDYRNRTTPSLRVHFWEPMDENRSSDPHTHPWHFKSVILGGSLEVAFFREVADEGGLDVSQSYIKKEISLQPPNVTGHAIRDFGRVSLVQTTQLALSKGSSHSSDPHVIHSAKAAQTQGALTLVYQRAFLRDQSYAYQLENTIDRNIPISTYSTQQLSEILERAISFLDHPN